MKKLLSLIAIFTLSLATLNAQDDKSKQILDKVSAKSKTFKTVSASFTSTLENKDDGVNMTKKGSIKLAGEKYNVNMGDQQLMCDGKTIWTFLEDDNEVMIDNVGTEEGDSDLSPSKLFTIWETGFKSQYADETTINGSVYHVIKLHPIDPRDKSYHTIDLYINKASNMVYKTMIMGKEGDVYTYTITNIKTNEPISDATFTFNEAKHPGVEVTDMR